jgi:hypothetical protein
VTRQWFDIIITYTRYIYVANWCVNAFARELTLVVLIRVGQMIRLKQMRPVAWSMMSLCVQALLGRPDVF